MISCLMVTQESHRQTLDWAVHDFARQTHKERELIVVHDGDTTFNDHLVKICTRHDILFSVHREKKDLSLGELRNLSVEYAKGETVCQWDDDDRYHSRRLEIQYSTLNKDAADFCFFTDQLHYFTQSRELFWDDWNIEIYPMNLIQGSLMGSKEKLPKYPSLSKGEDTPVIKELASNGNKVSQLSGHAYLYIYQYTGENTWDFYHHGAISARKRYGRKQLEAVLEVITKALHDYGLESLNLSGEAFILPTDDGVIEIATNV